MGYLIPGVERWARTVPVTLFNGTATASGVSSALELGDVGTLRLTLNVSAISGTSPSLAVAVETRRDSSDTWRAVTPSGFTTATGVSSERKVFVGLDRQVRVNYTLGGTGSPSATFSVAGEAV